MRRSRSTPRLLLLTTSLALCAGCGGSQSANGVVPSSPLTQSDALVFDDGVDFVADPAALAGRWAEDWERETSERVSRSDVIAVATVTTLRTDQDPQQRTTYRLAVQLGEVLKGKPPGGGLSLATPEGTVGFSSVDRDRQRVLNERFILFIKWYEKPDGSIAPHFHLSIASPEVGTRVRTQVQHEAPRHRTIERRVTSS